MKFLEFFKPTNHSSGFLLVLELHHGLHSPVVVVEVECPHHLASLEVGDSEGDLADGVAPHQLHQLSAGGELRVHLDGGQLQVLQREHGIRQ